MNTLKHGIDRRRATPFILRKPFARIRQFPDLNARAPKHLTA